MLERLSQAIEELRIASDGDELRQVLSLRDRLDARIAVAVADFDKAGLWEIDGATSMTAWLRSHARMTSLEAGRMANTAKRAAELPMTLSSWTDGVLSGGQVATMLASVRPEHRELFAEHEEEVVPALASWSVRDTGRAMAHWTANAEGLIDTPPPAQPERSLHASRALDNRVLLDGDLDADSGEIVLTALRVAETKDCAGEEPRAASTRRADALVDICRYFLDNQTSRPGGRHRPHVNVVVEAEDLYAVRQASYLGGSFVSPTVAAAMLCDCVMHRVVVDPDGAILDYGRATRTIPAAIWAALVVRDEGCRFPGCDRPAHWTEAHHVIWFSEGGDTAIGNLVLLCTRHHHLMHNAGWHAKLRPDATLEVTDPQGRVQTTKAPRALLRA